MFAARRAGARKVTPYMRVVPAGLPFADAFGRPDGYAEDQAHPWFTPRNVLGERLQLIGGKLKKLAGAGTGTYCDAFLKPGVIQQDVTVTVTLGAANSQVQLLRNDPTRSAAEAAGLYLFAWSGIITTYSLRYRVNGNVDTICFQSAVGALAAGTDHVVRVIATNTVVVLFIDGAQVYWEYLRFAPAASQQCLSLSCDDSTTKYAAVTVADPSGGTTFGDSFDRPDGAPGNGWSTSWGVVMPIVSHQLDSSTNAGVGSATRDIGSKDFTVSFAYTRPTNSNNLFFYFRQTQPGDASLFYFRCDGAGGTVSVVQRNRPVAGGSLTETTVSSIAGPASASGTWTFRVAGTSFKAYKDGALVMNITLPADKANQSTYVAIDGLRPSSSGCQVDTWLQTVA